MSNPFKSISSTGIRKFKCIKCNSQSISYTSTLSPGEQEMCNTCKEAAVVNLPSVFANQPSDSSPTLSSSIPSMSGSEQSSKQKNLFENKSEEGKEFERAPAEISEETSGTFANFRKYLFPSSAKIVEGQRQPELSSSTTGGLETLKSQKVGTESQEGLLSSGVSTRHQSSDSPIFGKQSKHEPLLSVQTDTPIPAGPAPSSSRMTSKQGPHEPSSSPQLESKASSRPQNSSSQVIINQIHQESSSPHLTTAQPQSQPQVSTPRKPSFHQNHHIYPTQELAKWTHPSVAQHHSTSISSNPPSSPRTHQTSFNPSTSTSLIEPYPSSPIPTCTTPPNTTIKLPSTPRILFRGWTFLTPLLHPPLTNTPLTHLSQSLLSYEHQYLTPHSTPSQLLEFLTMKSVILREGLLNFEFIPSKEMGGLVVGWQEWKGIMGEDEGGYERELEAVGGRGCEEVRRFRGEWDGMVGRLRGDFEGLC